jgi:hypothetical protein
MSIRRLSTEQQDIVLRCLRATAGHIDDSEKHSRLGLHGDELQRVIDRWPNVNDLDENGQDFLAINNCMNEVCHGFPLQPSEWSNWFTTPMSEVEVTYQTWLALRGVSGGLR